MRVAVHADFEYHLVDDEIRGEQAFTRFLVELAEVVDGLVLLGRLDPSPDQGRYPLGAKIEFVALPFYESLVHIGQLARASIGTLGRFWRALDEVDAVWLLGPHPLQILFSIITALRRRRLVVGVRQDFPRYIATRHPRRPLVRLAGRGLEFAWRQIAKFTGAIVVGPDLARRYRDSRRLLEITASLVREDELVTPDPDADPPAWSTCQILSVGRIDEEKNPLLLADVLERLRERGGRWRLVVVGDGPMRGELEDRLRSAGLAGIGQLEGYVPYGPALVAHYRESQVLLHVSWTEGLPQVLTEAFAASLPVVATDVGGIREAVGDAVLLIPPGDAGAAAEAIARIAADREQRRTLIEAGNAYARAHTVTAEVKRVAEFMAD